MSKKCTVALPHLAPPLVCVSLPTCTCLPRSPASCFSRWFSLSFSLASFTAPSDSILSTSHSSNMPLSFTVSWSQFWVTAGRRERKEHKVTYRRGATQVHSSKCRRRNYSETELRTWKQAQHNEVMQTVRKIMILSRVILFHVNARASYMASFRGLHKHKPKHKFARVSLGMRLQRSCNVST